METVTTNIRKIVKSLATAKGRREHGAFVTERSKNVLDMLESRFNLRWLIATHAWYEEHSVPTVPEDKRLKATTADMERMTSLNTPSDVMAVFDIPTPCTPDPALITHNSALYLALDAIQDPGNMGTIIRLADWFGIETIFSGRGTVDAYNPKCIISSMGSIARVNVVECDLDKLLNDAASKGATIWGTFMDGSSIYDITKIARPSGIIVMGNEGNGISDSVAQLVTHRVTIPPYPADRKGAESLNVAMATAIVLAQFRRPLKI